MSDTYSKKQVLEFLKDNPIMSISVNAEPYPISSVLLFAVDDDFTFHFATHLSSYKAKALEKTHSMSMSCWEHNKMLVQGSGIVASIHGEEAINSILDKLAASTNRIHEFWPPVLRLESDEYAVYSMKPAWLRVLDLHPRNIKDSEVTMQEIQL